MIELLSRALEGPFKTKSNFARENADMVAMAASDGFISTRQAAGLYSRKWYITPTGLSHLYMLTGRNHD